MSGEDIHRDVGAYALDALPPQEHAAFERHLATCGSCAVEAAELVATAARLGLAVETTAPPELKDRVMRGIRSVRQEPPPRPPARWSTRVTHRLHGLALAACVALAAVLGGVAWWQHDRAENARAHADAARTQGEVAAVLTAPDARAVTGALTGDATGTLVVSREHDRAVLLASGMAPPPTGTVYQLWFGTEGRMVPAGFLPLGRSAALLLDGPVGRADEVGITVEPVGGSPRPTSAAIALLPLPH